MGFLTFALLLPEPRQAGGGPQLPGFGLLAAGNSHGLLEAGFRLGCTWNGLAEEECALEPIRLREQIAPATLLKRSQRLGQQAEPLGDLAGVPRGFGEQDETERPGQPLSRGQDGGHALAQLRQARLALPLPGQRPAPPTGPKPHIMGKPLRGRQGQERLGAC